jgi:UDP-2-acetamido-3-amino-2,3-dideoxy-glucuronate N-acetyltransferase
VSSGARLGARCVLGQNVFVGRNVRIGRGVKIQNNVSVYEGVEIGDEVFLGPSCVFTNVINPRAFLERKDELRATRVGRGATIGANATIICGHDLGEYCLVGAGSVVSRGVKPYALVVGNPARHLAWVCVCGVRLPAALGERSCGTCARRFRIGAETCEALAT